MKDTSQPKAAGQRSRRSRDRDARLCRPVASCRKRPGGGVVLVPADTRPVADRRLTKSGVTLGVAGRPLLTLTGDGNAVRAPRSAPGLFHHAFLVPDRTELGRWLVHAAEKRGAVAGSLRSPRQRSDLSRLIRRVTESRFTAIARAPNGITERQAWWHEHAAARSAGTLRRGAEEQLGRLAGRHHDRPHPPPGLGYPAGGRFFPRYPGTRPHGRYPGASFFATGKYHHHVRPISGIRAERRNARAT